MEPSLKHISVEEVGDVHCVHLRRQRMEEADILEMADELVSLIRDHGCRKMVLRLGPGLLYFLYSVFLAKLLRPMT